MHYSIDATLASNKVFASKGNDCVRAVAEWRPAKLPAENQASVSACTFSLLQPRK